MEIIYDIAVGVMALSILGAMAFGIVLKKTNRTKLHLSANMHSPDELYEELENELEKVQKRRMWYKGVHYVLSIASIIGSIVIASSFFQKVFYKQVGLIGFLILLAALFNLFLRPMDKYYHSSRKIAYLKETKRKYNEKGSFDEKKANAYLRSRLNQYDNDFYEDMMF